MKEFSDFASNQRSQTNPISSWNRARGFGLPLPSQFSSGHLPGLFWYLKSCLEKPPIQLLKTTCQWIRMEGCMVIYIPFFIISFTCFFLFSNSKLSPLYLFFLVQTGLLFSNGTDESRLAAMSKGRGQIKWRSSIVAIQIQHLVTFPDHQVYYSRFESLMIMRLYLHITTKWKCLKVQKLPHIQLMLWELELKQYVFGYDQVILNLLSLLGNGFNAFLGYRNMNDIDKTMDEINEQNCIVSTYLCSNWFLIRYGLFLLLEEILFDFPCHMDGKE